MKLSKAVGSMGRGYVISEPSYPVKFRLYRVPLTKDGYDSGGAYWGTGGKADPLYHAYGEGEFEIQELFIRAENRREAKKHIRKHFPNARFFH